MGISPFHKSSYCSCDKKEVIVKEIIREICVEPKNYPNPNPRNFEVKKVEMYSNFLVALIKYPDCINFEGEKILVFENLSFEDFVSLKFIDPHFCEGNHASPIARFTPTEKGWQYAINFVRNIK